MDKRQKRTCVEDSISIGPPALHTDALHPDIPAITTSYTAFSKGHTYAKMASVREVSGAEVRDTK